MKERIERLLPGFYGLFQKEVSRFMSVSIQTVFGPVLATILFLFIFSHVFAGQEDDFNGYSYATFIVPTLAGMTMLQQSFSNSSSSLIVSKMMGNLVMILLSPIPASSFFLAYVLSSFIRGMIVALLLLLAGYVYTGELPVAHPVWAVAFFCAGCLLTSAMGVVSGIWAEKFDDIALFQAVILVPLTFLSGVFYSIKSLPPLWQTLSLFNPFTYFINGFRYSFLGVADYPVWVSFSVTMFFAIAVSALGYVMILKGYKIRN